MPPHILLVDDSPKVLAALDRLLKYEADWNITCAAGGEQALGILAQQPCDVLITDQRMNGIDGFGLLRRAKASYPDVVRLMLTGASDGAGPRPDELVHQIFEKPVASETLIAAVHRILAVRAWLRHPDLQRAVGGVDSLPSPPGLFFRLQKLVADPDVSAFQIAEEVKEDPALSAKILQLVNSAFFGTARKETCISRAVVFLGIRTTYFLAIGLSSYRAFKNVESLPGFNLGALLESCLRTSQVARCLLRNPRDREHAFAAGLLRGVGQLALASRVGKELGPLLQEANRQQRSLTDVMIHTYGVTDADIGAYLLGLWGLPAVIVDAVGHQYTPPKTPLAPLDVNGAVYVASWLVDNPDDDHALNADEKMNLARCMVSSENLDNAIRMAAV